MRRGLRAAVDWALLLAVASGLLAGSGCHTAPAQVGASPYDLSLMLQLEARTETDGPFLLPGPVEESGPTRFKASNDATSGISRSLDEMQWKDHPKPYVFPMAAPLENDMFLNLSAPVRGTLFFDTSAGGDSLRVRVEVKMGATRVGGQDFSFGAAQGGAVLPIVFRPEVTVLRKGEQLSLEVTRISGLSDFYIGTGSSTQSFIEFRFFPFDPLSSNVYLEGGRLITAEKADGSTGEFLARVAAFKAAGGIEASPPGIVFLPPPPPDEDRAGIVLVSTYGGLLGVGFAFTRLARQRRPSVAVAASLGLVLVVFAGCVGNSSTHSAPSTGPETPRASVKATVEPKPELGKMGAVDGVVLNEIGIPLSGAYVALLGTVFFSRTAKDGGFHFKNVTAGAYSLRVDAEKYGSFEELINVTAGAVTHIRISLVAATEKSANNRPHQHNDYGEASEAEFDSFEFMPTTAGEALPTNNWYCVTGARNCEVRLPMKAASKHIYPGTSLVEVKLTWTASGTGAVKEMGLRVVTAGNKSAFQNFVPRKSGDPFRIAIFPNEADPGHQKFTNWDFFLQAPMTDETHPNGRLFSSGETVHVDIKMFKGVVPFEPAHKDFWAGTTQMTVFGDTTPTLQANGGDLPSRSIRWTPPTNVLIPPGTKEIRGTMSWTNPQGLETWPATWNVWYKPANVIESEQELGWKKAEVTVKGRSVEFVIRPTAEETDQFYQFTSNWNFYPGDDDVSQHGYSLNSALGYTTVFKMRAEAFKDPDFTD